MPQKQLIWRNILEFAKFVISLLLNYNVRYAARRNRKEYVQRIIDTENL